MTTTYQTAIYQLTREHDGYFIAYILSLKSRKASTMSGYETQAEFDTAVKEHYGPDTIRVPKKAFWEEVERRAIHTPEMIALLQQAHERDLTKWYVYGSPCRALHLYEVRDIPSALLATAEPASGYYTYVATPELLDRDTIERYELRFVSGPEK
jgi:hypothetical protein